MESFPEWFGCSQTPDINLKTAEALVLTIPPSLLFQATEVLR